MYINTIDSCNGNLSLSGNSLVFPIQFSCVGNGICYLSINDLGNSFEGRFVFYQNDDIFLTNIDDNDGYLYLSSGDYVFSNYNFSSCEFGIITEGQDTDNWSSLFINNIQHSSSSNINITIPEEINWDYTGNDENFDLYVNGYNVDTEYIESVIEVQNYKPSSEDFTNLVGLIAPYSKYLLFILFVVIIWAWIKKPFKSKKL